MKFKSLSKKSDVNVLYNFSPMKTNKYFQAEFIKVADFPVGNTLHFQAYEDLHNIILELVYDSGCYNDEKINELINNIDMSMKKLTGSQIEKLGNILD